MLSNYLYFYLMAIVLTMTMAMMTMVIKATDVKKPGNELIKSVTAPADAANAVLQLLILHYIGL